MTSTTLDTPKRSRHRPTMPCATCPALLWWHKSYVLGMSQCQDCRRSAPNLPGRGPGRGTGRMDPAPIRQCVVCGEDYLSPWPRTRTCSRSCGGKLSRSISLGRPPMPKASLRAVDRARCARRRARLAEQIVETVDPDVVFDRDRWRCHLCGKRIDRTLSGRHRLGPTLDHLIPLVAGGEHSYANVAAAHRACNSGRVSRRNDAVQLALVG